jgi:hypothetical protein
MTDASPGPAGDRYDYILVLTEKSHTIGFAADRVMIRVTGRVVGMEVHPHTPSEQTMPPLPGSAPRSMKKEEKRA